ncbi:unnamed protein product [Orchesella dallaii]|uniref:Knr4/Smi1-like domain-containing protein n=1 Tax=Orchesella dallaii TaxID=48710 RepID=A0ABP1SA04_9HEXA
MIRNIKSQFRKPADKHSLSMWERKNGVTLPTDLKEYYQSTNGFKLTWSLEHAGDILPIGEMNINPLNQLTEIHIAAKQSAIISNASLSGGRSIQFGARPKTCSESSTRHSSTSRKPNENQDAGQNFGQISFSELEQTIVGSCGHTKMTISGLNYNPNNKMFILDCGRNGWGKVCLVYPPPPSSITSIVGVQDPKSTLSSSPTANNEKQGGKPEKKGIGAAIVSEPYVEIWFMDPSFQWHYLAPTFTHFYRMLLFHLGLPQWQYRFTPFGLSSWAEQMFWLVAPHLLQTPKLSKFPSMYHGAGLWCTDLPSEVATPNPILNVLSNQLFRRKKKDKEK